jgi:RNA polymerase sigma-70 factor (ECF subfamily)
VTLPIARAFRIVNTLDVSQSERSSQDMLAAAQSGDVEALNQLVRMHRHGVYRYGLQVCRTTEDAEDAVQETLWAATRAIKTFRGSASSIVSWMFTIVRRECLRLVDRHRRSPATPGAERVIAEVVDPDDTIAGRRRAALLAAALGDLDPIHREVILLRDIQELSAPEAAAHLGISVDALKSRLHRARVNLREHVLARSEAF